MFLNFRVSDMGGVLYFEEVGNITLLFNNFYNNSGKYGGVIYYMNSKGIK